MAQGQSRGNPKADAQGGDAFRIAIPDLDLEAYFTDVQIRRRRANRYSLLALLFFILGFAPLISTPTLFKLVGSVAAVVALIGFLLCFAICLGCGRVVSRQRVTDEDKAFIHIWKARKMLTAALTGLTTAIAEDAAKEISDVPDLLTVSSYSSGSALMRNSVIQPVEELRDILQNRMTAPEIMRDGNLSSVNLSLGLIAVYLKSPTTELLSRITTNMKAILPEASVVEHRNPILLKVVQNRVLWIPVVAGFLTGVAIYLTVTYGYKGSHLVAFTTAAPTAAVVWVGLIAVFRK